MVTDIGRGERQNTHISVFGWDGGPYQIRIFNETRTNNVDLSLLVSAKNQHYVWIKKPRGHVQ